MYASLCFLEERQDRMDVMLTGNNCFATKQNVIVCYESYISRTMEELFLPCFGNICKDSWFCHSSFFLIFQPIMTPHKVSQLTSKVAFYFQVGTVRNPQVVTNL